VATVALALRLLLAVVFATAGVGKLLDREGSVKALGQFGVGGGAARIGGIALPIAELAVAVALIFPPSATIGAIGATLLLVAFIAGISRALLLGINPDCHCFGQIHSAPAGPSTLVRNGVLAAMALIVLIAGPGPAVDTWIADRTAAELAAVGLGMVAVVAIAATVTLWLDNRKLHRELEDAKAGLPEMGLPIGVQAPNFTLRDNDRKKVSLKSLLARGKPVVLVFVGPTCGPCWLLMPHISRWQDALSDRVTLVMVSVGTRRENAEAIDVHEISGIFLHGGAKLMEPYRVLGTPTSVIIGADGRIASQTVDGARPLEPLIRTVLGSSEANGAGPHDVEPAALAPA